jgi:heme/copper-type cytochrome/quinol oxidase subunit 1
MSNQAINQNGGLNRWL